LKNIGFLNKTISNKLNIFFDRINQIFEPSNDGKSKDLTIEWLLNKAQVDKLVKIVAIIDEYNNTISDTFRPVNKFLNIINKFFKDTGKKLIVDEVGRLFINKPHGRPLTVDELSSGERQLIILFANVIFNKLKESNKNNTAEILIIDEPEISLHIRWQELFIDSLFEASNRTQFVIATHSPDIIGEHKFKTKKINKK
jgi:predicted ATP-binding protein involved in virulence